MDKLRDVGAVRCLIDRISFLLMIRVEDIIISLCHILKRLLKSEKVQIMPTRLLTHGEILSYKARRAENSTIFVMSECAMTRLINRAGQFLCASSKKVTSNEASSKKRGNSKNLVRLQET